MNFFGISITSVNGTGENLMGENLALTSGYGGSSIDLQHLQKLGEFYLKSKAFPSIGQCLFRSLQESRQLLSFSFYAYLYKLRHMRTNKLWHFHTNSEG